MGERAGRTWPSHTEGPWEVRGRGHEVWHERQYPNGYVNKLIAELRIVHDSEEELANFRLIAAAPDLLAKLRALANAADIHVELADLVESARAAIAKAEGR